MSVASSSRSKVINLPANEVSQAIPVRRKLPWRRHITPYEGLLAQKYEGQGTDAEPYIVDWLVEDAENPQHWKSVHQSITVVWTSLIRVVIQMGQCGNWRTGSLRSGDG
jgi:hypothetical protein